MTIQPITVVYWRGPVQHSDTATTYAEAMEIADRTQNKYSPQFYDASGNELHDNGYSLVYWDASSKTEICAL